MTDGPNSPAVGDRVVPAHPSAGVVTARDVRGGRPGCLVRWPGMEPIWYPDDREALRVIAPATDQ